MLRYIKSLIFGYRYFYVSYSFDGGFGCCWSISMRKGLFFESLKKDLEKTGITKITIINFIEVSRSEFIININCRNKQEG